MNWVLQWVLQNKAKIGWVSNFLAGGLVAAMAQGVLPPTKPAEIAAFVLSYVGAALVGAGSIKSDKYYQDQAK